MLLRSSGIQEAKRLGARYRLGPELEITYVSPSPSLSHSYHPLPIPASIPPYIASFSISKAMVVACVYSLVSYNSGTAIHTTVQPTTLGYNWILRRQLLNQYVLYLI